MNWMAWTLPTALFFIVISLTLTTMTIWEHRSPSIKRRGFLPIATTRGDRLFIGLLTIAFFNLGWIALTDASQWIAFAISLALFTILGRRG